MLRTTRSPRLQCRLRALPHQAEAIRATRDLPYAALFHEQGLGKTKMALDLALAWLVRQIVDSVIVVTKKSLVQNWIHETSIHTYLSPITIGQDRHRNYLAFNRPGRFYLTHYEAIYSERGRFHLFSQARRLGVILDEAQKIKNPDSKVTKALHALAPNFTRRVIMTGTPVANRPYDIWSPIYFLDQGESLSETYNEFKTMTDLPKCREPSGETAEQFEQALMSVFQRIQRFTIRETKASVSISLPAKDVRDEIVSMEPRQAELYRRYRENIATEITREGIVVSDQVDNILKRLLRLVQVASNPRLVDEGYDSKPCKLTALERILNSKRCDQPKTILWTNFTKNVSALASHFKSMHPAVVHGKLPISERNRQVGRFLEEPRCLLLVATPGAAKEGLTLTVANHAVFVDRSFSLDDYLQAQDRIHRISQTNPCLIEVLIARNSVDEWVDELLVAKQLAAALVQSDINLREYQAKASYNFNQILSEILQSWESTNEF